MKAVNKRKKSLLLYVNLFSRFAGGRKKRNDSREALSRETKKEIRMKGEACVSSRKEGGGGGGEFFARTVSRCPILGRGNVYCSNETSIFIHW